MIRSRSESTGLEFELEHGGQAKECSILAGDWRWKQLEKGLHDRILRQRYHVKKLSGDSRSMRLVRRGHIPVGRCQEAAILTEPPLPTNQRISGVPACRFTMIPTLV